jgi:hypothetical protein
MPGSIKERMIASMMNHPNTYGAGAAKRRKSKAPAKTKVAVVMHEFKAGKLHSGGSGKIVTNPKQAIAIAISEQKRHG